ncbi:MAG TPA: FHA domain-containing protein [Aggregicoccus sp.]|nr:FHA domain-containing protein [Aggregicoccus sp.]
MAEPTHKIVILPEELAHASVDQALTQQLSFGMAAAGERVEDKRTGFFYRAYVALALAGALGGFVGWAVIEPFFDDGVQFEGKLEQVQPDLAEVGSDGAGWVQVSGVRVWVAAGHTRVERDGEPLGLAELAAGQAVTVRGETFDSGGTQSVSAVALEVSGQAPADGAPVDLKGLERRQTLVGLLVFVVIAAFVGLFIGAADGLLSRAFWRAAVCGLVGMGMGLSVGLVATMLSTLTYGFGRVLVERLGQEGVSGMTTAQLIVQMTVRGLAWALAGAAMGLGQGVALRSSKLLVNGLLGGMVGALVGGLLFDPIDLLLDGSFGSGDASVSRAVGFTVIGLVTGLMIGIVELVAREAWIKMLTGPLAGKEFVLFKSLTSVGSSPKSDVYLFKDPDVEPAHALIHVVGDSYELEDKKSRAGSFVNGRKVSRVRLQSGDQVRVGKTVFSLTVKEE